MAVLPRPVEVRHDGRWVPAALLAARRGRDGRWRGLVQFTAEVPVASLGARRLLRLEDDPRRAPLAYLGRRGEADLRPAGG